MLIWLSFILLQLNPFQSEEQPPKIKSSQKLIELKGEKTIKLKVKLSAFRFELKKDTENAIDIKIKGASPIPKIKETKNKDSLKIDICGGVQSRTYFFQNINNRCDVLVPGVLSGARGATAPALDLDISVSGNSSSLDFSGLSVANLKLLTGGDSKVSFPTPNPVKCKKFYICPRFSNFKAEWLGNANADNYYFSAGAGNYALDFRGQSRGRKYVEISLGIGMLKLVFPARSSLKLKSKGVYVKSTKKLAKDENGWYIYNVVAASPCPFFHFVGARSPRPFHFVGTGSPCPFFHFVGARSPRPFHFVGTGSPCPFFHFVVAVSHCTEYVVHIEGSAGIVEIEFL